MTIDGMTKGNWVAVLCICITLTSAFYSVSLASENQKNQVLETKIEKVEDRVGNLEKRQHGLSVQLGQIKASLSRIEEAVVEE